MELDITFFFRNAVARDYSASVAEIGPNAGADTWQAACDDSSDYPILTNDEQREAFREFVRSSGGWNDDEIAKWSDVELNALCIQWIAGDMREVPDLAMGPGMTSEDWECYREMSEEGTAKGSLWQADDGRVYWNCGD